MSDMKIYINYDKDVYSDVGLTEVINGPHVIKNSTRLPKDIYFSNTEYIGQAENSNGDNLFKVRFTNPADVSGNQVSIATGAIYDES